MKRILVSLIILGFSSLLSTSGQETINSDPIISRSSWSITFSYSPYLAFVSNSNEPLESDYRFYPMGFNASFDWRKESARLGLSLGATYRIKSISHSSGGINETVSFLEFPFQIKYHLKRVKSNFDPYLAPSIRLCRFESDYRDIDVLGSIAQPYIDYIPIVGLGVGSVTKITGKIDILFESNFGYGITKVLPNRAYIDFLIGTRFTI